MILYLYNNMYFHLFGEERSQKIFDWVQWDKYFGFASKVKLCCYFDTGREMAVSVEPIHSILFEIIQKKRENRPKNY